MSWGLLTRRPDGTSILTPDTFTVRAVETFYVGGGESRGAIRYARPGVKAGMFATCTPSESYAMGYPAVINGKTNSLAMDQMNNHGAWTPAIVCYNGGVELHPPMQGGAYKRNIYVHVFEYL